jgi:hypothetical protein
MTYTLILWTTVACGQHFCKDDWRQLGVFGSEALCVSAAQQLNLKERYRCVSVGR